MRFLAISDTFLVSRHAERAACLLIGASAGAALTYYFYFRASASQGEWAVDEVTEPSKEAPEHKVDGEREVAVVRSTAASGMQPGTGSAIYESARAVNEYLAFHFLPPKVLLPYACGPKTALNFTKRCADLCKKHAGKHNRFVLDLGCAVGGQSMELTRHFQEVLGLDFSQAFVDAANTMKENGKATVTMQTEGELTVEREVQLPLGVFPQRARFVQGDACNLPKSHFGPFDCILCANLLCRLPSPQGLLERLPSVVKPGGVVIFVSPYSWLLEYTAREKWMGGVEVDGESVYSETTLKRCMKALHFDLVEEQDMPFLIREHARKFQWGCSHATVWRRRNPKAREANASMK